MGSSRSPAQAAERPTARTERVTLAGFRMTPKNLCRGRSHLQVVTRRQNAATHLRYAPNIRTGPAEGITDFGLPAWTASPSPAPLVLLIPADVVRESLQVQILEGLHSFQSLEQRLEISHLPCLEPELFHLGP